VETSGALPPKIARPIPGPRSAALVERLAAVECPAFTTRRARRAERTGAPHDPIVWSEARGANVIDADGNCFVDLTAGFGVAAVGHAHPRIVEAVGAQSGRLLHALGDLHPSDVKIHLLDRLASMTPLSDARVILGTSGSDAVEAALKTAVVATGRPGVLAFEGGYHGLAHGPLAVSGYSEAFRAPFLPQLNPHVTFAPYPGAGVTLDAALDAVRRAWPKSDPGAIIVEPMLGRGGVVIPPAGFLRALGALAHERGALFVVDEIFTGLGRAGALFRSIDDGAAPDLLLLGKALGGGLPVSACIGRGEVMAAWGDPAGAALHTGTFFGHPLGCAAALAALDVIDDEALVARANDVGGRLRERLEPLAERSPLVRDVRGRGLMIGVELASGSVGLRLVRELLERGYLTLPSGRDAEVLQLVPPLVIDESLLEGFVAALFDVLDVARAERWV
jgi:4-aminobutyrate aminotransferase/(S)-3-amino-2-methylpropionate transaminase